MEQFSIVLWSMAGAFVEIILVLAISALLGMLIGIGSLKLGRFLLKAMDAEIKTSKTQIRKSLKEDAAKNNNVKQIRKEAAAK